MEDLIMKKLIMFFMVLMLCLGFVGEAKAQPVCLVICPTNAGAGDEVSVTAYDENNQWFDLSGLDIVKLDFDGDGGDEHEVETPVGLDISSGHGVFTITQEMLDSEYFEFYFWPGGWLGFRLAHPARETPFDTVAEAVAAGGSCPENLNCGSWSEPKIAIVDANDIYEQYDPGPPPGPLPAGPTSDKMLVSLPAVPWTVNTITVIIDPNLEGAGKHDDFIFTSPTPDPCGRVTLTFNETNWNVQQPVAVKAVQDTDREGNESYDVLFTFSDLIDDPNFNSDPCSPLISEVTVIDNDIPHVSASPDPIEISENDGGDPCGCVKLKVRLSHVPTDTVYVLVYPFDWAFDDGMVYIDPPLDEADDPNKLTFTVTDYQPFVEGTMTSGWNVEQEITVCPIDNDETAEDWTEYIYGDIYLTPYSEDERYRVKDATPDGSETEDSGGIAYETVVGVNVQDNDCGATGFAPQDYNTDCTVGLADLEHYSAQWLICTDPFDDTWNKWGDCAAIWNIE
jgi:hypothetical protein